MLYLYTLPYRFCMLHTIHVCGYHVRSCKRFGWSNFPLSCVYSLLTNTYVCLCFYIRKHAHRCVPSRWCAVQLFGLTTGLQKSTSLRKYFIRLQPSAIMLMNFRENSLNSIRGRKSQFFMDPIMVEKSLLTEAQDFIRKNWIEITQKNASFLRSIGNKNSS